MLLRADSLASTHAIARAVAELARTGDIIVLAGDMGAGKTAFAQGFGRALGITEAITSPTFTLLHSYPCPGGRTMLHHADLYRLDRTGDVDELALPELAEFDGIVLVEWGDVAAAGLGDHLEVRLLPDVAADGETIDDEMTDDEMTDDEVTDDEMTDDEVTERVIDGVTGEMTDEADREDVPAGPDDADDIGRSPAADADQAASVLDDARLIEITAGGRAWAGRWDRLTEAVAAWRC